MVCIISAVKPISQLFETTAKITFEWLEVYHYIAYINIYIPIGKKLKMRKFENYFTILLVYPIKMEIKYLALFYYKIIKISMKKCMIMSVFTLFS